MRKNQKEIKNPQCDCGHIFTDKDVSLVEMTGPEYYPYEGNIYLMCCTVCGFLTDLKEDEINDL